MRNATIASLLAGACSVVACSSDGFLGTHDDEASLPDEAFTRHGLPPRLTAQDSEAAVAAAPGGAPRVTVARLDETPPVLRMLVTDVGGGGVEWGGTASCRVVLRLYDNADHEGEPAWRSDAGPGVGCDAGFPDSTAPPGGVARRFPVPSILGDSLDGGRYYATATVRSGDVAHTVNAGSVYLWNDSLPPVSDRERLRWVVETAVVGTAPPELVANVTVTNSGRRRVRLAYDECSLRLRLFRTPLRLLTVWSAEERADGAARECTDPPSHVVLAPRESFTADELSIAASVPEILGDSLREGHYYVGAELALPREDGEDDGSGRSWTRFIGGASSSSSRERVPLEAGVVELRGRRGQLTAERTVGGLTYRAASRLVRGAGNADTVRVAVMVTNTGGQRVVTAVLRDCPVLAYAYRDASLRDALPMRDADWSPPMQHCSGAAHRFALAPGQSWAFNADIPTSALPSALADAPIHLTAVLRTPERLITLAAGTVQR
ncbi:MAG TPA: hypothetical protein VFX39_10685 [Gemmatimonadaceae bacterium]|nr:hypothetical protein [Gemmatimonadaceae bacterium]